MFLIQYEGFFRISPLRINIPRWIIETIGKHIIAQNSLAGGGVGVGIDEAGDLRIVISGLYVIEISLGWVLLCTRRGMFPSGRLGW